ncbi:hypothetical protein BGZ47_001110, partial [Haplosporangium gracile]
MDPEPAPENFLTRGYPKRSLAAIETEFVDSNTFDAPAPPSSVLQSDNLIIDENNNLGEHLDMSGEVPSSLGGAGAGAGGLGVSGGESSPATSVTSTTAVIGGENGGSGHAAKRVRYSFSDADGAHHHPTAAELSVLQPVIQPDNSLRRELGGQQHGHHTHHHNIYPHSVSRGRSVADLLPSTTDVAPLDMDEDASEAMGDPVDSSLGALAMEVEPSEEERRHSHSHGPVEGRVTSAAAFLEPKKRLAIDLNPVHHHTATETLSTTNPTTTTSSLSSYQQNQTTPSPERKRSLSISSTSTFGTPGATHHNSAHLADKKGLKREVKIQLLDEMESKPILEEARRASIDQQREAREDKKHPPSSSSSPSTSSSAAILTSTKGTKSPDQQDEEDMVLPKEDPSIHDWDQEELEDEDLDSDSTPSPASLTSGNIPRQETISSLQKRQRKLDRDRTHNRDRRRASFLETGNSQPTSEVENSNNNSEIEEDKDDPFLDPERDLAFMSEAQEADTHNVHLRLENQREFQDAAGLDLGEEESSNVNEDGQYGGMIEEEDEGDDFWEN